MNAEPSTEQSPCQDHSGIIPRHDVQEIETAGQARNCCGPDSRQDAIRTLETDWLILDCELLPWSAKAEELLRRQYASVGAAAAATLATETEILQAAVLRGAEVEQLLEHSNQCHSMASGFVDAYRRYCWPTKSIDDLRLAPFQILAGEGQVHALTNHAWHLESIGRLCDTNPNTFRATPERHSQPGRPRPRSERGRLVGASHRDRRRGHGRQTRTAPSGRSPSPESNAAGANAFASSTDPNTPPNTT